MIERMQCYVMYCCGTAVIYKTPYLECFEVTMPPSSFGLNVTSAPQLVCNLIINIIRNIISLLHNIKLIF